MKKPETTSPYVARIAGKVLRGCENAKSAKDAVTYSGKPVCTISELRSLAASALTQAPDKKTKK